MLESLISLRQWSQFAIPPHLLRHRKKLASQLYQSVDAAAAEHKLREFEENELGKKYPMVGGRAISLFAFSPAVRTGLHNQCDRESQQRDSLRRYAAGALPQRPSRPQGSFPGAASLLRKWAKAVWGGAKIDFVSMFGDRFQPAN